jgi:hypothetical protein
MKKLREWSNKNSGFLAFWGIILTLIIWISPLFKIKVPTLLNGLVTFFAYKISIPIYGIAVFLMFLIVVFYNKIGPWNRLFFKTVQKKVMEIISDSSTFFEGSPTYPSLPKHQNAYTYMDGGYWNKYHQFSELSTSNWISHGQMITDQEALKGGIYQFTKDFNIDYNLNWIEEAILYFIVDDHCSLIVNNNHIGNYHGFATLHKVNIKSYLIKGINTIKMEITNDNGNNLISPKYASYVNKKGVLNPYGIKFNLRILNK